MELLKKSLKATKYEKVIKFQCESTVSGNLGIYCLQGGKFKIYSGNRYVSGNIVSLPGNVASPPRKVKSWPANVESLPRNIVNLPMNVASRPRKVASWPGKIVSGPG